MKYIHFQTFESENKFDYASIVWIFDEQFDKKNIGKNYYYTNISTYITYFFRGQAYTWLTASSLSSSSCFFRISFHFILFSFCFRQLCKKFKNEYLYLFVFFIIISKDPTYNTWVLLFGLLKTGTI